jgi:hypothetical protein
MFRASLCSSSGGQLYIYSIWYRPTLHGSIQHGQKTIKLKHTCKTWWSTQSELKHCTKTWPNKQATEGQVTEIGACVLEFNILTQSHFFTMVQQPPMGQDLLIIEASRSHSDALHSVGLLWTSDQVDTQTSTWQHTALTTDRHPCPRRDSKPKSEQASGRGPTP